LNRIILIPVILLSLFLSCNRTTSEFLHKESKFSILLPTKNSTPINERSTTEIDSNFNQYSFSLEEVALTISISSHFEIEGENRALQFLLNKLLSDQIKKSTDIQFLQEIASPFYIGAEALYKIPESNLYIRTVIGDNRKYQIELQFIAKDSALLQKNEIEDIISSIKF